MGIFRNAPYGETPASRSGPVRGIRGDDVFHDRYLREAWRGVNRALVLALLAFLLGGYFMNIKRDGWAFGMTGAVIALLVTSVFVGLFPRVMVSSINSAFDLTIYNAASGPNIKRDGWAFRMTGAVIACW